MPDAIVAATTSGSRRKVLRRATVSTASNGVAVTAMTEGLGGCSVRSNLDGRHGRVRTGPKDANLLFTAAVARREATGTESGQILRDDRVGINGLAGLTRGSNTVAVVITKGGEGRVVNRVGADSGLRGLNSQRATLVGLTTVMRIWEATAVARRAGRSVGRRCAAGRPRSTLGKTARSIDAGRNCGTGCTRTRLFREGDRGAHFVS